MDRFRRMEIFVAVVEAGQLTRASQALHLSKSAVSHALNDLENFLNIDLLNRTHRKWQLTEAGTTYYRQCKKVLDDVQAMEDRVRHENQNLTGLVRLSAPSTFGSYKLAPVVAKFMDMNPGIVIEINLTDGVVDLIEERVDIAFQMGVSKDSNLKNSVLEVHTIGQADTMICASPSYLKKFSTPQSHLDLKSHKCIRYTRRPIWQFTKAGRRFEFMPKDHLMTDSGETLREFCVSGQGLALMSSMQAAFAVKSGLLVRVLKDYDYGSVPIEAVRVAGNRAPIRVIELLQFITGEFQSLSPDIAECV